MPLLLISWWYGEKFKAVLNYSKHFLAFLYDLFSVRICLTTLFAVWRRDRISYSGLSLKEAFQAFTLNLASRFIGMIVKVFTVLTYLFVTVFFALAFVAVYGFWLTFPLAIAFIIYLGFSNL